MKCRLCDNETNGNRKLCQGHFTKIRRYRNKMAAIHILGGKCLHCGVKFNFYNYAIFEFHHLKDKKFSVAKCANKSWDIIKEEIKKCKLLCANCHQIEHSNYDEKLFEMAFDVRLSNELGNIIREIKQNLCGEAGAPGVS